MGLTPPNTDAQGPAQWRPVNGHRYPNLEYLWYLKMAALQHESSKIQQSSTKVSSNRSILKCFIKSCERNRMERRKFCKSTSARLRWGKETSIRAEQQRMEKGARY